MVQRNKVYQVISGISDEFIVSFDLHVICKKYNEFYQSCPSRICQESTNYSFLCHLEINGNEQLPEMALITSFKRSVVCKVVSLKFGQNKTLICSFNLNRYNM